MKKDVEAVEPKRRGRSSKMACPYEQEYAEHFGTEPSGLVHGECGFDLFRTHDTLIIENFLTGQRYTASLWVETQTCQRGRDFLRWRVAAKALRNIPGFVRATDSTGLWDSLNSERSNVYLFRLIMAVKGERVEGRVVHHMDGNTLLGDWPSNLAVLTVQEHERIHSDGEAFYHVAEPLLETPSIPEAPLPEPDDSYPEEGHVDLHYPTKATVSGSSENNEEVEERRQLLRPLGLLYWAKFSRRNSRTLIDFNESIGKRLSEGHPSSYPYLLEDLHGCRGSPGPKAKRTLDGRGKRRATLCQVRAAASTERCSNKGHQLDTINSWTFKRKMRTARILRTNCRAFGEKTTASP